MTEIWAKAKLYYDEAGKPTAVLMAPLPPTDNHLYFIANGRKVKTKKAVAFDNIIRAAVGKNILKGVNFDSNKAHSLLLKVFFEKVYTAGYPKRAKRRFFKCDVDNRRKLIIDSLSEAIGIDDSCITYKIDEKHQDAEHPRIELTIKQLE